jgi:hypothetical protein
MVGLVLISLFFSVSHFAFGAGGSNCTPQQICLLNLMGCGHCSDVDSCCSVQKPSTPETPQAPSTSQQRTDRDLAPFSAPISIFSAVQPAQKFRTLISPVASYVAEPLALNCIRLI